MIHNNWLRGVSLVEKSVIAFQAAKDLRESRKPKMLGDLSHNQRWGLPKSHIYS
jgi:hypothetical protein